MPVTLFVGTRLTRYSAFFISGKPLFDAGNDSGKNTAWHPPN
jgi:hypothetical protein